MTTIPSNKAAVLAQALIRNLNNASLTHETYSPLFESQSGSLSEGTAAQKLSFSLDIVPPGKRSCPYHFHHAQEEAFLILEGTGTLRVAGEYVPIQAGDVLFIPAGPDYPHQIINTSHAELKYLSISTKESPEVVEYPDSGKYLTTASAKGIKAFRALQRTEANLDYWEGEI
ncbi:cupin domain-containing protein [Pseudomonas sp. WAC2]|uniref:cupin domain-containing protein n=1 Tax=Pseudomonas sp. WAC2 TaxID=3055057 RepID=UPI0025AF0709|nr:cupin domain-containing protein [Pseudomonas sp. WAC2]MDN3237916.1 cupin domain-containing protein [Pseudomonas sp. WAC2]